MSYSSGRCREPSGTPQPRSARGAYPAMRKTMLMSDRKKLGEILVDVQVLTPVEVERVLDALRRRRDRAKFGRVAREMGLLREEHILAALAVQMQMFPRVSEMSLSRLLDHLQDPAEPVPLRRRKS